MYTSDDDEDLEEDDGDQDFEEEDSQGEFCEDLSADQDSRDYLDPKPPSKREQ